MDIQQQPNQQPTDYNSYMSGYNNAGYQAATALQIRLDTSLVVRQIEMYLKGIRAELVQDVNGKITTKTMWKGKPMVNDYGYQSIMNWIEIIFNPQVVQGNFEDYDMYADYLCRTRKDLADHLMKNMKTYGIKESEFSGLISALMRFIEAFMSRLIGNKERESYANTMRTSEVLSSKQGGSGGGGFWSGLPFMGGGK